MVHTLLLQDVTLDSFIYFCYFLSVQSLSLSFISFLLLSDWRILSSCTRQDSLSNSLGLKEFRWQSDKMA